ncbi:MAG TPA: YtxH domain-containing protein [Candidatus Saccharimonadales bacterium]|nr:YtxH domain-containing protein [Candidatus Saccharimonadales bacterium]
MTFNRKTNAKRKIAIGSAIAGVVGYAAGILTAPKSGKQTRSDIVDTADNVMGSAEVQLVEASDELKTLLKSSKDKAIAMSSSARTEFNEAVIKAKDAQNKAGVVLKAFRQGEADDPELNKAVKQAKLAAKNLGKFLKS